MKEVYEFLKQIGTYYIATVEGDQPRVRPFGTINLFEDKLYIQTGKSKSFSKQLATNPKFEICACEGGKWLRVSGILAVDENNETQIAAQTSMLESYPNLKGMYQVNDGNNVVFYLKDVTATFSSFDGENKTVNF